ncbi:sigma-70 family RNA polymerase sigma factor [Leucobacter sp. NPDC058333]|uniref:sigma-70 family RNA polymerase sigma factor n=1 Tax=Leucobacter sp. NPDC058333 TaxID=3346450 RepID=UPI00366A1C8E
MSITGVRNRERAKLGELTDRELIDLTRAGVRAAYGVLWQRHLGAAYKVAHQFGLERTGRDAEELVSEAFLRVLKAVQDGKGPTFAFRPYLTSTVRNLGIRTTKTRDIDVDDFDLVEDPRTLVDPVVQAFDDHAVATAFKSLPLRWQEVLWLKDVEGLSTSEISGTLKMKANAVAQLTLRAREGLREAWVRAHLGGTFPEAECEWVLGRLVPLSKGKLSDAHAARATAHLERCSDCGQRSREVGQVFSRLRAVLVPLVATGASGGVWLMQPDASASAAAASSLIGHGVRRWFMTHPTLTTVAGVSALAVGALVASTLVPGSPTGPGASARVDSRVEAVAASTHPAEVADVVITSLSDGEQLAEPLTVISGTGQPRAQVSVRIDEASIVRAMVGADGGWAVETTTGVGVHELTVKQAFKRDVSRRKLSFEVLEPGAPTSKKSKRAEQSAESAPGGFVLTSAALTAPASGAHISPTDAVGVRWTFRASSALLREGGSVPVAVPGFLAARVTNLPATSADGTVLGTLNGSGSEFTLTLPGGVTSSRELEGAVEMQLAPVVEMWPNGSAQTITVAGAGAGASATAGALTLDYAPELLFTEGTSLIQQRSSGQNDLAYRYSSGLLTALEVGVPQTLSFTVDAVSQPNMTFNCGAIRANGPRYQYGANTASASEYVAGSGDPLGMRVESCSDSVVTLAYTPVEANRGFSLSLVPQPAVAQSGDALLLTDPARTAQFAGPCAVTSTRQTPSGAITTSASVPFQWPDGAG